MTAALPDNETARLEALYDCAILDTAPELTLDDITRLAAQICKVPIAAVSLIDQDRQWFKSIFGLDMTETPRNASFCAHTILQPDLMIVADAWSDARFADNPLVTGDPGIRFYAGAPLTISGGLSLGALCVIDREPRELNSDQQAALRMLARQAGMQMELKRQIGIQERLIAERIRAEGTLRTEIIEREWAEVELEKVLTQNAQILTSIPSILITVDEQGLISTWNTSAAQAFGLRTSHMLGTPFADCKIAWDGEAVTDAGRQSIARQEPVRLDPLIYITADGKERCLEVTINPIHRYSDEPKGFLLLATDITERRRLESQLSHAQKLESIGQLAAGIAHEINTPIQYVGDNLRFLKDAFRARQTIIAAYQAAFQHLTAEAQVTVRQVETEQDAEYLTLEVSEAIAQGIEGVERVIHIVQAMKEFSHPGTASKTATDLNRALVSTLTVAHNEWKYVADLQTEFDPHLPLVPCLPADINQVFLNMIVNAAHAIGDVVQNGEKGILTVSTRACGDWAEIRIGDTGTGMTEEVKARIFDPFFTTKPVGRGTGQGLAISHCVVAEKHDGTIAVETVCGQGSTFVIRLPIKDHEKDHEKDLEDTL